MKYGLGSVHGDLSNNWAAFGAGCFVILLWIFGVLASLGIPIAIVWIGIHFARKYW